jgi:hypothetical protein
MLAQSPVEITERQQAPHDLNDEETEVWVSVVSSEAADWFTASTRPLLAQYCRHVVQSRRVAELLERALSDKNLEIRDYNQLLKMQDRESRAISMLATKMRISPQSTINKRGNQRITLVRKPWEQT